MLDNTFIIFSSDHGYKLGQWRIPLEKMWPFETDIRIPFYIRGPGIKPGTVVDVLGMNMDIAPTLLDLAGVDSPLGYDGRSLMPMLDSTGGRTDAELQGARAGWRTRTVISFAEGYTQTWGKMEISIMGAENSTTKEPIDPQATVNPPNVSSTGVMYVGAPQEGLLHKEGRGYFFLKMLMCAQH